MLRCSRWVSLIGLKSLDVLDTAEEVARKMDLPKQINQVGVRRSSRKHFRRIGSCPRHGTSPVEGVDNDVVSLNTLPDRIDRHDADFKLELVQRALSGGCSELAELAELQIDGQLSVPLPSWIDGPQIGFQADDDLADGKSATECRQLCIHVSRLKKGWICVPATIQDEGVVRPEHFATLSSRLLAGAQNRCSA